eukprot:CAMPEP_0168858578 /NCGR_PEP_ID=MMETSP0727-20121128/16362_1 /TAXON_ID=265536 /ORGANISM="Amphiprora sp., Strain CCMP467" /LENGTH=58 /DNA_ID=CAMNT_0008913331 /DNA_START=118 /DNA_END=290 /DNA_ORIENTATION=-
MVLRKADALYPVTSSRLETKAMHLSQRRFISSRLSKEWASFLRRSSSEIDLEESSAAA